MQAVLLAGGKSSRFYPFNTQHKSTIPLLGKMLIEHTLEKVREAGVRDIIIVVGKDSPIQKTLSQKNYDDLQISYVMQPEPLGMGDALLACKDLLADSFFVLHGHHVDFGEFQKEMYEKKNENVSAVLLLKKKEHFEKYGCVSLDGDTVTAITEKPGKGKEPSPFGVIGIYLLSKSFLSVLKDVPLDHYNFENALTQFAKKATVKAVITDKETVSLKYVWDLLSLNKYLLDRSDRSVSEKADIAKSAELSGSVIVEEGARILDGARVKGPCYIGKNAYVGTNALVRNYASLGESVVVGAQMEVKNSILFDKTKTHSGFIGDCVIGSDCKIAAFFCTANVRLDKKTVRARLFDGQIDTELHSLGAMIGSRAKIGIRVSTMPGVIIGNNVTIGPSTTVTKNVKDDTVYYAKFQEIVEEKTSSKNESKKNKLVLFDIDYTLFNTDFYIEELTTLLAKKLGYNDFGVFNPLSKQAATMTIKDAGHFNPEIYLKHLIDLTKTKLQLEDLQEIFWHKVLYKKAIYTDVRNTFEKLADNNIALGILSTGNQKHQRQKIHSIVDFLEDEHVHIFVDKLAELQHIFERYNTYKIFLVDDLQEILVAVKALNSKVFTIWMNKKKQIEKTTLIENFVPDQTVISLSEIVSIVKEN